MSIIEDTVWECKQKEKELLRLLQVKAEKLCNSYLNKHEYTQLSYLSKDKQEFEVSVPKRILLDKMISYLKSI